MNGYELITDQLREHRQVSVVVSESLAEFVNSIRPAAWQAHAACLGLTDLFFFPDGQVHSTVAHLPRQMCRTGCPVREECLEYTLTLDRLPAAGIWAGYSIPELRVMRRQRAQAIEAQSTILTDEWTDEWPDDEG